MNRLARALMALGLLGAVAAAIGPPAPAVAENGKVTLCHLTDSVKNQWVAITISENEVPAHLAHGDHVKVSSDAPCPQLDDNGDGYD